MSAPCCERWREETGRALPPRGGVEYAPGTMPDAQIERDSAGKWNVNGCCGGGCYVLCDLRFCPWCGAHLVVP